MIRSANRSTSCSTCELTITVRPCSPKRRNRSIKCARCTGSAPFRGSSSTSTLGSVTSAAATLVRWRIPLLNPPTPRSATSSMSTSANARSGAVRSVERVQVRHVADQLPGGEPGGHGLVLRHERHVRMDAAVATRVAPVDADGALVQRHQAGDRAHQRRLAGTVRSEQPGDAGAERATQLGQRDLLAEPHRCVGRPRPWRRRRTRDRGRIGGPSVTAPSSDSGAAARVPRPPRTTA